MVRLSAKQLNLRYRCDGSSFGKVNHYLVRQEVVLCVPTVAKI